MSLRGDLVRALDSSSLTEVTKELSAILDERAAIAFENGDTIYGERLKAAADHFWMMEDFGV
jgi:hypothetical protein